MEQKFLMSTSQRGLAMSNVLGPKHRCLKSAKIPCHPENTGKAHSRRNTANKTSDSHPDDPQIMGKGVTFSSKERVFVSSIYISTKWLRSRYFGVLDHKSRRLDALCLPFSSTTTILTIMYRIQASLASSQECTGPWAPMRRLLTRGRSRVWTFGQEIARRPRAPKPSAFPAA